MPGIDLPITLNLEAGKAGLVRVTSPTHPELRVSATSVGEALAATPGVIDALNEAHEPAFKEH